jgi:hypothetical protein
MLFLGFLEKVRQFIHQLMLIPQSTLIRALLAWLGRVGRGYGRRGGRRQALSLPERELILR